MKKNNFKVIAGTYALHNYTMIRDGIPGLVKHWGTGIDGVITYSPTGFVTTTMRTNDESLLPVNLAYPPQDGQVDSDWAKIGRGTLAYAGPYSINVTSKTTGSIAHGPLIAGSIPGMTGHVLVRNYSIVEIEGETFVELSFATGQSANIIWWRRLD
ncbi:hypothetical protein QBC38DRAFT_117841 [Podospora fimiseda]|uniref:Lipocalin-like domain-containing protein n=1 Tax=Podospora fimiseda TaxID=252190 RepID=A0AAN7BDF8_9PEZI|nr:hypothetical protein QBC38DRAFT_117841 [Podospora fimiseda]